MWLLSSIIIAQDIDAKVEWPILNRYMKATANQKLIMTRDALSQTHEAIAAKRSGFEAKSHRALRGSSNHSQSSYPDLFYR